MIKIWQKTSTLLYYLLYGSIITMRYSSVVRILILDLEVHCSKLQIPQLQEFFSSLVCQSQSQIETFVMLANTRSSTSNVVQHFDHVLHHLCSTWWQIRAMWYDGSHSYMIWNDPELVFAAFIVRYTPSRRRYQSLEINTCANYKKLNNGWR